MTDIESGEQQLRDVIDEALAEGKIDTATQEYLHQDLSGVVWRLKEARQ